MMKVMIILLRTQNARHYQSSLALPYLKACLEREMPRHDVLIQEGTIHDPDLESIWRIAEQKPDVLAFSCYLWNIEQTARLARGYKNLFPETLIVAGGPEVGHTASEALKKYPFDVVVKGEGEQTFLELIEAREKNRGFEDVLGIAFREGSEIAENPDRPPLKELDWIPSPFTEGLIDPNNKKPFVYYETSRGCPFCCRFCASSLTQGVRFFSLERVKKDLTWLLAQNYPSIRVVDRTFNFPAERAREILNFLIEAETETTFQLEIKADSLDEELFSLIERAPKNRFKFEIGLQSVHPEVLKGIERFGAPLKVLEMTRRLHEETFIDLHIDLIAGLPGENYFDFLSSLDAAFQSGAGMIQVGILKLLPGTRLCQEAKTLGLKAMESPPYVVLETPELSWRELRRIAVIEALVGFFHNAGRLERTLGLFAENKKKPFGFLYAELAEAWENKSFETGGIDPFRLYDRLYDVLKEQPLPSDALLDALVFDFFSRERSWDRLPAVIEKSGKILPRPAVFPAGCEKRRSSTFLQFTEKVEGSRYWLFHLENGSPVGVPIDALFSPS